jgi:hypothetical protein
MTMAPEVRWGFDQRTGRWIGDGGDFQYWRVTEGEHAGKFAFIKDGNPNIFYCDSPEEAQADANRIKKFSGL